jgi:hypothetical protein
MTIMPLLSIATAIAAAAPPPNIVFFLTDDQDQVLGASFPPTAPNGVTLVAFWSDSIIPK